MYLTNSWWFSPCGAWTLSAPHNKSVSPYKTVVEIKI